MDLGQRLQMYRESAKITQLEMAGVCGVSKNYLSAVERGVNKVPAKVLIGYAQKLNVSIDTLVGIAPEGGIIPDLQQVLSCMNAEQQEKVLQIVKICVGFNTTE